MYKSDTPKNILYTADGQWSSAFSIKDKNKKEVDSWNVDIKSLPLPEVKEVADQDPLETRRAWSKVADAIKKGDMDAVHREKTIIENEQRELRKKEKTEGTEWERKFFKKVEVDPTFDTLAKAIGATAEPDQTGGVWIWKE